ncbi:hypothetical protein D3C85_935620 [compost metagenome]
MPDSSQFVLGADLAGQPVAQAMRLANRHGLVAGATGTGKTVTCNIWPKPSVTRAWRYLPPTSKATCAGWAQWATPRARWPNALPACPGWGIGLRLIQ